MSSLHAAAAVVVASLVTVASPTIVSLVLQRRLQQRRGSPATNPPLLSLPGQPGLSTVNYESIVTPAVDSPQPATAAIEEYAVVSFGSGPSAETLLPAPGIPSLSGLGSPAMYEESDIFPFEADFPVVPTQLEDLESLVDQQQELAS
ncbi:hypothetical protein LTR84_010783 [Exophiala bonariae]|uniref:Uncharacterized protein n=1 Tax=Exophiala bonariae TaxID=1690606 RepID=A0AAV9NHD6_9EURO|nr:hypothetical protein LTR84_010783 [Exophiala bonariae]